MERSPSEAKTELERWAAHFVRGYLPDLAEHKDRIAEVVVDRLWGVLIGRWYEDLLSERAWRHAVLQRLRSDWPEAASRISFALDEPCSTARREKWDGPRPWRWCMKWPPRYLFPFKQGLPLPSIQPH
jgi:hypothetical protein